MFGHICFRCGQEISAVDVVFEMGKYWHRQCFACMECGKTLPTSLYPYKDRPYCREHYQKVSIPTCGLCQKPIEASSISLNALGKSWHPPCFYEAQAAKHASMRKAEKKARATAKAKRASLRLGPPSAAGDLAPPSPQPKRHTAGKGAGGGAFGRRRNGAALGGGTGGGAVG